MNNSFYLNCIFSHYYLAPLYSPPPYNHHTVVHVHESFLLFAQSLQPLTSPPVSCHPALCGSVSVLQTKLTFSLLVTCLGCLCIHEKYWFLLFLWYLYFCYQANTTPYNKLGTVPSYSIFLL